MGRVIITGANRGIGLELCRIYAARGQEVIGVCRRSSPELDALGVQVEAEIDVADDAAMARLVARVGGTPVDVLIHNAGILRRETLDALDLDSIREQFEVNSLGPLRLTAALRADLGRGSKVAIITSRMGSIGDNTSGSRYGYRMSKAAVNMAGVSLSHDMRSAGVAVAILHPGFVRTGMTGGMGDVDAAESATGLVARIDGLTLENSGTFWHAKGQVLPW